MVLCGADRIAEYEKNLKGKRVGLLTNQSGQDSRGISTIHLLMKSCELTALFGPEHGVSGKGDAGQHLEDGVDPETGLPVYSLYGEHRHFTEEMLAAFDMLVYDIQDVGARFYTYISTLHNALTDCARAGKQVLVLDRPNPLGGRIVEGGLLKEGYESFVGCYPLPIRYGLTAGELALMMNEEQKIGCDLEIAVCQGWRRDSLFPDWGWEWRAPSVALTSFESALLYPGTCLFEGVNLSEGRGTEAPFCIIGADYVDGEQLCHAFDKCHLPGVKAEPVHFTPTCSKYEGIPCQGLRLHVTDVDTVRPVTVGVVLLDLVRTLYAGSYALKPPHREGGKPGLALLSGGDRLLGNWDCKEVLAACQEECRVFLERKARFHLYA